MSNKALQKIRENRCSLFRGSTIKINLLTECFGVTGRTKPLTTSQTTCHGKTFEKVCATAFAADRTGVLFTEFPIPLFKFFPILSHRVTSLHSRISESRSRFPSRRKQIDLLFRFNFRRGFNRRGLNYLLQHIRSQK